MASPGPPVRVPGGRGAYAIRVLPDLCFGIVSGRLGYTSLDGCFHAHLLEAPARPGLSLSMCASTGTEPGGWCSVCQLVMRALTPCVVAKSWPVAVSPGGSGR